MTNLKEEANQFDDQIERQAFEEIHPTPSSFFIEEMPFWRYAL